MKPNYGDTPPTRLEQDEINRRREAGKTAETAPTPAPATISTTATIIATPIWGLFYSHDTGIGFDVTLCDADGLVAAVRSALYTGEPEPEQIEESRVMLEHLLANRHLSLEDGWLELRSGTADIVAFVMEKAARIKEDERHSDQLAGEQYNAATAANDKYKTLRDVLIAALGDHVDSVVAAAKSDAAAIDASNSV